MYSRDEPFLRSLEGYFGIYFPRCFATREINTKITLSLIILYLLVAMETQAEYETLKQYMATNAGWCDRFQIKPLSLGDMIMILKVQHLNTCYRLNSWITFVNLLAG